MTQPLPPELWDAIVEHLDGDPCALQACALTCAALVAPVRCVLFRTFALAPRRARGLDARAVARAVLSTLPVLAPFVRTLRVSHDEFCAHEDALAMDLAPLARGLPHVRMLEFARMFVGAPDAPVHLPRYAHGAALSGVLACFGSLRALSFVDVRILGLETVVACARAVPMLEELAVARTRGKALDDGTGRFALRFCAPPGQRVDISVLGDGASREISTLLLWTTPAQAAPAHVLRRLEARCFAQADLCSIAAFLSDAGVHLAELELELHISRWPVSAPGTCRLRALRRRTIEILTRMTVVLACWGSLSSPHLTSLTLRAGDVEDERLYKKLLETACLPELRRLALTFDARGRVFILKPPPARLQDFGGFPRLVHVDAYFTGWEVPPHATEQSAACRVSRFVASAYERGMLRPEFLVDWKGG
jgi:hypothetical protein